MTDAEMRLWNILKQGIQGCKFRRQHPIAGFIADFYCHRLKLIVEIDGSVHDLETVIKTIDDLVERKLKEITS